jgi:hypothetical protein
MPEKNRHRGSHLFYNLFVGYKSGTIHRTYAMENKIVSVRIITLENNQFMA